jgi:hypothetical protein
VKVFVCKVKTKGSSSSDLGLSWHSFVGIDQELDYGTSPFQDSKLWRNMFKHGEDL